MRIITIKDTVETYEMAYDNTVNDAEALHVLLCYVSPEEEYTVTFKNKGISEPIPTESNCVVPGCSHGIDEYPYGMPAV